MMMNLTKSQIAAIENFRLHARKNNKDAFSTINHILEMSNISHDEYADAINQLKEYSQVALHFHPDRFDESMTSVAQSLFETGAYKSQFETKISNGSVSARPGGDRDLWEKQLYGGAYHEGEFIKEERVKYGALRVFNHSYGPAPSFGSCFFLLKPQVSNRCTYTYSDSHQLPNERGTIDKFDHIVSELMVEIFTRNFALGEHDLTISKLIKYLRDDIKSLPSNVDLGVEMRKLHHYIEVQVHGKVSLEEDVEFLVADPSFKNTDTGNFLEKIATKYNIQLHWNKGSRILVDKVPHDFRGPRMQSLAQRISGEDNFLTSKKIGAAAQSLKKDPKNWSDRGNFDEVLQEIKLLWHCLVRFGGPINK